MAFQDYNIQEEEFESVDFPSVIFKVDGVLYCINSEYIETLIKLPVFTQIPEASQEILGVFPYRENFITTLNLRTVFGIPTLADKCADFSALIAQNKKDHQDWVDSIINQPTDSGETPPTMDPRSCDFGKWCYEFKSENSAVDIHLKKMELPHKQLFEAAQKLSEYRQSGDSIENAEKIDKIISRINDKYLPEVFEILDRAEDAFHSSLSREMVIIFRDINMGIAVDEVLMVDHLDSLDDENSKNALRTSNSSKYISGVLESDKLPNEIILEINVPVLLAG